MSTGPTHHPTRCLIGNSRPHLLLAAVEFVSPSLGSNHCCWARITVVGFDSPLSSTRWPPLSRRTLALGSPHPTWLGVGFRWSQWRSLHPHRSSLLVVGFSELAWFAPCPSCCRRQLVFVECPTHCLIRAEIVGLKYSTLLSLPPSLLASIAVDIFDDTYRCESERN